MEIGVHCWELNKFGLVLYFLAWAARCRALVLQGRSGGETVRGYNRKLYFLVFFLMFCLLNWWEMNIWGGASGDVALLFSPGNLLQCFLPGQCGGYTFSVDCCFGKSETNCAGSGMSQS